MVSFLGYRGNSSVKHLVSVYLFVVLLFLLFCLLGFGLLIGCCLLVFLYYLGVVLLVGIDSLLLLFIVIPLLCFYVFLTVDVSLNKLCKKYEMYDIFLGLSSLGLYFLLTYLSESFCCRLKNSSLRIKDFAMKQFNFSLDFWSSSFLQKRVKQEQWLVPSFWIFI